MKKINFLFALLFVCTLISCDKDEDENTGGSISSELVGTWQLFEVLNDGVAIGLDACDLKTRYTFNSDGSFTEVIVEPNFGSDGGCNEFPDAGKLSIEGNNLIFTYVEEGETFNENKTFGVVDGILIFYSEFPTTGGIDPATGQVISTGTVKVQDRYKKI